MTGARGGPARPKRTTEAEAPRVVLASQSPRRRDLLALIGIPYTARPADIDESILPGESAVVCVQRLAEAKAARLAAEDPEALVIGADTIVVIDDRILNKPADEADARRMLSMLRGRKHLVYTAVCVQWGSRRAGGIEPVAVQFRPLSDPEVDAYIATGEPMDKAGAYGIQGYGATIVERIEGDFFAVMGLPLVRLVRLLGEVGIEYQFGRLGIRD